MTVRLIKHEAVPDCGSFEVRYADGRPSVFFYWDDIPGRRVRPDQMDSKQALQAAKTLARAGRDREFARHDSARAAGAFWWKCANSLPRPKTTLSESQRPASVKHEETGNGPSAGAQDWGRPISRMPTAVSIRSSETNSPWEQSFLWSGQPIRPSDFLRIPCRGSQPPRNSPWHPHSGC